MEPNTFFTSDLKAGDVAVTEGGRFSGAGG